MVAPAEGEAATYVGVRKDETLNSKTCFVQIKESYFTMFHFAVTRFSS
jgi:hypothetical protein